MGHLRPTGESQVGPPPQLHLAHNEWDSAAGRSVPKILYGFGRADQLETDAIRRPVASLTRLLEPADALAATATSELALVESRPCGGAYLLDQLWRRLDLPAVITGLGSRGRGHPRDLVCTERVIFGLVANRALAPSSKLAAAD